MNSELQQRLVRAGLVTPEALAEAGHRHQQSGRGLADCLVQVGAISELDLLRFWAQETKVRFLSGKKLALVKLDASLIEKVPVRLAERKSILPLSLDAEGTLLLAVANPSDGPTLAEVKAHSRVRNIAEVVALEA